MLQTRRGWIRAIRSELGTLAAVLVFAGGLLGFALLADEMMEGDTHTFDRKILLSMRSADDVRNPIGPPWFESAAQDLTSLGSNTVLVLVSLSVIGFLVLSRAFGAAVLVFASVSGGVLMLALLKAAFVRARPDFVPHAVQVFTDSFPSGHATLSAITYLTLGALLARVQPHRRFKAYLLGIAIMLTLLVGTTRVYLGVHWPTDVIAGWCIGSAWAIACWLAAVWFQRRGQVEERIEPDEDK